LRRTVRGGDAEADVGALAVYVKRVQQALGAMPTERLLEGEIDWPAPV
jgi:hypothetical protein